MCSVSRSPSSYKSQIDAQAEAEGVAADWFREELGLPEVLTRVQLKALEYTAMMLRGLAAEAGEWRLDEAPKYYRTLRGRMIRRSFKTETRRAKKWWTAPSDWLTTVPERRAHTERINREREARVASIRAMGQKALFLDEAAAASGLNELTLQRAAKTGRIKAAMTTRAVRGRAMSICQRKVWSIRAVDLADFLSTCKWSNRGKLALPREQLAVAVMG